MHRAGLEGNWITRKPAAAPPVKYDYPPNIIP
jgi:hypothetical protein